MASIESYCIPYGHGRSQPSPRALADSKRPLPHPAQNRLRCDAPAEDGYDDFDGVRSGSDSGWRQSAVSDYDGLATVSVVDRRGRLLDALDSGGQRYAIGKPGKRYELEIVNHTGRRYEVVASVDGLDAWFLEPQMAFSARLGDFFSERAKDAREDGSVLYEPALMAQFRLRFDEDRVGFIVDEELTRVWYPLDATVDEPAAVSLGFDDVIDQPPEGAKFGPLPEMLDEKVEIKRRQKDVSNHVYRSETKTMYVNKKLKLTSKPEESLEDFAARSEQAAVELGGDDAEKLRDRYQAKVTKLEDRIEGKKLKLAEQEGVARSHQLEEAVHVVETLLGMFGFGRKKSVSSAMSKRRLSARAAAKVDTLADEIARLEEQAEALVIELDDALEKLEDAQRDKGSDIQDKEVRLEKADIELVRYGLVWVPSTRRPLR